MQSPRITFSRASRARILDFYREKMGVEKSFLALSAKEEESEENKLISDDYLLISK